MPTVDEYVQMAEEAQGDNAHVAVMTYYRDAIESTGYGSNAAPILLVAAQYAQRLKKGKDRKAIAQWIIGAADRAALKTDLVETIIQEIKKLQTGSEKNATTP